VENKKDEDVHHDIGKPPLGKQKYYYTGKHDSKL
jgi:hypothetical protein